MKVLWGRIFMHIPHGVVLMLAAQELPWVVSVIGAYYFMKYEENEDGHLNDEAFRDILGALVGMAIVIIPALILKAVPIIAAIL